MAERMLDSGSICFDNTFFDFKRKRMLDAVETASFTLIQAVDLRYLRQSEITSHAQCCDIELTALLGGGCSISVDGIDLAVQRGAVHVVFRDEAHAMQGLDGCRFQNLAFNIKPSSPYAAFLPAIRAAFADDRLLPAPDRVRDLIGHVIGEFYRTSPATSALAFECIIGQVVLELYRAHETTTLKHFDDDTLCAIALGYIDTHFADLHSIEEMAARTDLSYTRLHHTFVAAYGISPRRYLAYKKMEHAAAHLREGKLPLSRISEALGYSSSYNFSRAFKTYVGVSPREYRDAPTPLQNPIA